MIKYLAFSTLYLFKSELIYFFNLYANASLTAVYIQLSLMKYQLLLLTILYCYLLRNPTNDPGGPFCFVQIERDGLTGYEQEYCDIPQCEGWQVWECFICRIV